MQKLDLYADVIFNSALTKNFSNQINLLENSSTSMQEKAFLKDLQHHLPNGLLKNATHICKTCVKSFKTKKKNKSPHVPITTVNDGMLYYRMLKSIMHKYKLSTHC